MSQSNTQPGIPLDGVTVRPMTASDANGVIALFSEEYGTAYVDSSIYQAGEITKALASGNREAFVAVTAEKDIVGHVALSPWLFGGVYEIGMLTVAKAYRHRSLGKRLTAAAVQRGEQRGDIPTLMMCCDARHPYSQQTAEALGFRGCGFSFHLFPEGQRTSFSCSDEKGSGCLLFRPLRDEKRTVVCPACFEKTAAAIYREAGFDRVVTADETADAPKNSRISRWVSETLSIGDITFEAVGKDGWDVVCEAEQRELSGVDTVHLFVPMNGAETAALCNRAVCGGYFFSGMIPGTNEGDFLYLTKCRTPLDFDKLIGTPRTGALLAAIRRGATEETR